MAVTGTGLTRKSLTQMNKDELIVLLEDLKIEYTGKETNPVMISLIEESGKYITTNERGAGKVKTNEKGERIHPTLGKYIKVRVHPTGASNQKTSIFVSINLYTVEFQPSEMVSLPLGVVKFLKEAGEIEHYFDKNAMTENGNIGAHSSRTVKSYIVEIVNEELEEIL